MLTRNLNVTKTFFAMPLFNWQEPSISHITNQHFWIYWAITGPLTLVTMVLVISWAVWHRSYLRAEVWRARKDIDGEKTVDDNSGYKKVGSDHEVDGGSKSMDMERGEKWFDKAFLRRRQLRRTGMTAKQDDPESLKVNKEAEVLT
jgi:hypothetical protein